MPVSIIPEQAMANFGSELRGIGRQWGQATIAAENNRQVANADAEMINQWDSFQAWTKENQGTPGEWLPELERRKESISASVLAKTSQPGARQYAENSMTEQWARWSGATHQSSIKQMATNATGDFKARVQQRTQSKEYPNELEFIYNMQKLHVDYNSTWNGGNQLGDLWVSETHKNLELHDNSVKMATDFFLQYPGENDANINNPNAFLRDKGIDLVKFTPEEIVDLKKRYLAEKSLAENMADIAYRNDVEKATTDALKLATSGDLQGAQKLAVDMLGKYPHEKFIDTLNNIQNAASVLHKTGQNPYATTQDPKLAHDLKVRAENTFAGKDNLTMQEVESVTGTKISSPDRDEIKRRLTTGPTAQDFEKTKASQYLIEMIDAFGRRHGLYEEIPTLEKKGLRLLQDGIAEAKPPLTGREKDELALRIFNNLQTEPITSAPGALLTPTEKAEELGQSLDKAVAENIAYQKTQGKSATIPQPQSQAEFDTLPSGTRYRRNDGSIWMKR